MTRASLQEILRLLIRARDEQDPIALDDAITRISNSISNPFTPEEFFDSTQVEELAKRLIEFQRNGGVVVLGPATTHTDDC